MMLDEDGEDFDDDDGDEPTDEPNFNRADGAPVVAAGGGGPRPNGPGGRRPGGQRRPGGRRRRGGRRPGPGSGGAAGWRQSLEFDHRLSARGCAFARPLWFLGGKGYDSAMLRGGRLAVLVLLMFCFALSASSRGFRLRRRLRMGCGFCLAIRARGIATLRLSR